MKKALKLKYIIAYFFFNAFFYFTIKLFINNEYDFSFSWDNEIPFVPEFIWIYHTLLPVMFSTLVLKHKSKQSFYLNFWTLFGLTTLINCCYLFFPSFYPYPEFQPSSVAEFVTYITHELDGASNTFPSGHVAFSWLLFLGVYFSDENSNGWFFYLVWSLLICCSTLFLKQHYIVDVLGGVVFSSVLYFIMKKFYKKSSYNMNEDLEFQQLQQLQLSVENPLREKYYKQQLKEEPEKERIVVTNI